MKRVMNTIVRCGTPQESWALCFREQQIDPVAAGRDAEAAFRVGGKKVSREEFRAAQEALQPKRQPKYLEEEVSWKGGLAQRRAAEAAHHRQQAEVCRV